MAVIRYVMGFVALICMTMMQIPSRAWAATDTSTSPAATNGPTKARLMDAVPMEAVETYADPRKSEIDLGVGIYPFDAYYYGLSINGGYVYHPSRNFAWEIVHFQYFFSFEKDLTTELAERYGVNPKAITELKYLISTDIQYVFAYGKFALVENYLRYFRASALAGMSSISTGNSTSSASTFAPTLGLRFQIFTRENFSWNFEARDSFALSGSGNYLTFSLGTGLSF